MTLQAVTHASDSPLTLDRVAGDDADVSMFADVTSLAFTNIGDGEVVRAKFKAFSGARVVNLTGFQVINGYVNPGAVTVPNGGTYVVVAFGAFGGVYLSLGFAEAPPTVAGVAQILPAGGDAGQLLGKVTGADYDYGLVDPPAGGSGLPGGGTTGQVLAKTTNTDGDADWSTLPDPPAVNEVPAGGTTDQVLTKLASGYDWADVPVPASPVGVSIHDYGPGVGEGNIATDDAAFAWLLATHPGVPWLLKADTDYNISTAIDISGIAGQQIIGGSRPSTRIRQHTLTTPIIIWGSARGQRLQSFTVIYVGQATDPGAVALQAMDDTSLCTIDNVLSWYSHVGLGLAGTGSKRFFSNKVDTLEIRGWSGWAISLDCSGGSSGNHFSNIYLNNNDGVPQSAIGVLYTLLVNDSAWNQLNIEACVVTGTAGAVMFDQSQGQAVNSFHIEQITVPNNDGIVHLVGYRTGLYVSGMRVHDCVGGGQSSYFYISPDMRLIVHGLDPFGSTGFDYICDGPFWVNNGDTYIEIKGFMENTNNGGAALLGPAGATLGDNVIRSFNGWMPRYFDAANRPTPERIGHTFFATEINGGAGGLATWNGTNWIDAAGNTV